LAQAATRRQEGQKVDLHAVGEPRCEIEPEVESASGTRDGTEWPERLPRRVRRGGIAEGEPVEGEDCRQLRTEGVQCPVRLEDDGRAAPRRRRDQGTLGNDKRGRKGRIVQSEGELDARGVG